jgi:FkbM family methyltransferase
MSDGPQYNERQILQRFFGEKTNGFLVEVGAADGIDNSHTEFLIRERDWSALLIEPHPQFFEALVDRYSGNPKVFLSNIGILLNPGIHTLYMNGQISRFLNKPDSFKYLDSENVECNTLSYVCDSFDVPKNFDFLTIDAEEKDIEVLKSLDWSVWEPQLICVEHTYPDQLRQFFSDKKYSAYDKNIGNTFFARTNDSATIKDL